MQDLISRASDDFEKVLELLAADLAVVKTGRAKPNLIEDVGVQAYEGQEKMTLKELATISVSDSSQLIVSPWDKSVIESIEKALSSSKLNLNPVVDGNVVRITIPALTEEVRKDLVKMVKKKLESGRVLLRGARRNIKEMIDSKKGTADVSEDDIRQAVEDLNKLTDEFVKKIEEMGEEKEKELMSI